MRIRSLDHLVLTVSDVDATVRFYELLGMSKTVFGDGRVALRRHTGGARTGGSHRRDR